MDNGGWLPSRVVPFDGSSRGKAIGPPGAGCTYVAWSPNGTWMYFDSDSGGRFHLCSQYNLNLSLSRRFRASTPCFAVGFRFPLGSRERNRLSSH